MGNVSPGGKIQSISVDTHTAFTGGSQEATIEVGTTLDNDQLHGPTENDTTEVGTYISNPEFVHPSTSTSEYEINLRVNHYGATAGNVTVKVTYI